MTTNETERLATRLDSSIYYDDQKAAALIRKLTVDVEVLECALKDADTHIAEQADAWPVPVRAAAEPVPDDIVAGALYDFLGYLTTRRTRITMSDRDDAGAAVDALIDWSKTRKINLTEARVRDWNTYTMTNHVGATQAVWDAINIDLQQIKDDVFCWEGRHAERMCERLETAIKCINAAVERAS